jgi:hypothetical protein
MRLRPPPNAISLKLDDSIDAPISQPKRKLDAPILRRRVVARPRCVRNAIIEFRTLQTDAVSRTRHLQRADCHADRLGDLLTAHSALDQIPDLRAPC